MAGLGEGSAAQGPGQAVADTKLKEGEWGDLEGLQAQIFSEPMSRTLICLWQVNCIRHLLAVPILEMRQRAQVDWSMWMRIATQATPSSAQAACPSREGLGSPDRGCRKAWRRGSKAKSRAQVLIEKGSIKGAVCAAGGLRGCRELRT